MKKFVYPAMAFAVSLVAGFIVLAGNADLSVKRDMERQTRRSGAVHKRRSATVGRP